MRKTEAYWVESRQRWQIKVQSEGERKTFTSPTPGKKGKVEAEKKADKWLDFRTNKDIRFGALWELYLEEIKSTTGTANYDKNEQLGRIWILPHVGRMKLSKITDEHWQKCVTAAAQQGRSKRTCGNIRTAIMAAYRFAKKGKYPLDEPEDIKIPTTAPVGERKILQPNDLKILFSEGCIRHYGKDKPCFHIHAWRFMVLTGLRRGEVAGLMRRDIKDDIVYVRRAVNEYGEETGGKTDAARRYFALSEMQAAELAEQLEMLKSKGIATKWVFPDTDGARCDPNSLYKHWLTYRKQHGITSSLHELRHTFISIAKADVPEQLLKQMVGHTNSMDTFGVYGHEVDGEMQRTAKILDDVFSKLLE